MEKLIILTFLLIFATKQAFSQDEIEGQRYFLTAGISYQKQLVGEIGVAKGFIATGPHSSYDALGFMGIKLASEFNFDKKQFFIAPKVAVEADLLFLALRVNLIDYTDFTHHDFKFTPEIGLSWVGFVNLTYGYNISLNQRRLDYIGTNRITLTMNFSKEYLKSL